MAADPDQAELKRVLSEFALGAPRQVSHGLNLTLELKDPDMMPLLLLDIFRKKDATRQALQELKFVHFARFLPQRDQQALLVITEFDGPMEAYVKDFVIAIGDVFDAILKYVKGAEAVRPVKEFPDEFVQFVQQNNQVYVMPGMPYFGEYPLYSAYPDLTVIDILQRRDTLPAAAEPAAATIDFSDVQGNILRGFNASLGRHFALRVADAAAGRAFLAALVSGDDGTMPQVTPATPWASRPAYFLTVGVTADGLKALGVPQELRERMPRAFIDGPADEARAARNGDVGDSDPSHWDLGNPARPVHLLVSLYADAGVPASEAAFAARTKQLRDACKPGAVEEMLCHETRALPDNKVHFGYRDSISQPRIAGVSPDTGNDLQPRTSAGAFLLGADYVSIYGGSSLGMKPAQLCANGTFAAVRMMDQDVDAFEKLLDEGAAKTGQDREWVAAKLMGRWRDGTPLAQAPLAALEGSVPTPGAGSTSNAFDYAPSQAHPAVPDDAQGRVCPIGSHMRRMNPRSGLVAGTPYSHRLIRRGMPYEFTAKGEARRGLFGMFLCADLERQFEFLLQEWGNADRAALGLRGTQDPIVGAQTLEAKFRIPLEDGRTVTLENVPRLVQTRGSVYLLMPGLAALRCLARGFDTGEEGTAPGTTYVEFDDGTRMRFWPDAFDPKDPRFLANPYPYYAAFRRAAPVSLVKHGGYRSWWVFRHELVKQVCDDEEMFLKEPPGTATDNRGLFFMDPPRHEQVRAMADEMFARATEHSEEVAREQANAAIGEILRGGATFDLIPQYSNRVTRNVFMKMFGVPEWQWGLLGAEIDTILKHFDQMLPTLQRAPAAAAGALVMGTFLAGQAVCPHAPSSQLFAQLVNAKRDGKLGEGELVKTALHFALGGYLSTDFLVGTAIHNLLSRGAVGEYLHGDDACRVRALEELMRFDAPFQMADRFAARDTTLATREIRRGDRVTVVYGSANHDERVFPRADDLLLARTILPGENYVFGHGIHRCIGAPLAPKVARIAIDTLLARVPQLALAHGVPARYQDPYYRGFSSLTMLHR